MTKRRTAAATLEEAGGQSETGIVDIKTTLREVVSGELGEGLAKLQALNALEQEDRPVAYKAFNVKLKDKEGNWISPDLFYDTLTEETQKEIHCVLLDVRKSRRYSEYIEGQGRHVFCQSWDALEGETEENRVKECATCPNKDWQGSTKPNCSVILNFLGLDLEHDLTPFIVRAKHTSLGAAKKFLAKYFLGKLKVNDHSADLPLFVAKTRLFLTRPTGTYAVLGFESVSANSEEEIRQYKKVFELFRGLTKLEETVGNGVPEEENGTES